MSRRNWRLEDVPWTRFDASKVDRDILKIVKAASLVEHNGRIYADYLCGVFHDDPVFQVAVSAWGEEEVQHGVALARWAKLADAGYDFADSFEAFAGKITLPMAVTSSVRGSRCGELIARCMVEVGTSSYYTALGDATDEPLLKALCRLIAADELRHYKLFYKHMKRYQRLERVGFWRRLWVAALRIGESEDGELAYAYYAANRIAGPYDRRACNRAYVGRAYGFYRRRHVRRGIALVCKAVGLKPNGRFSLLLSRAAYGFVSLRAQRFVAQGL